MMTFRREVSHKLRVLQHADRHGDVSQTCRYFGIGRASFYRWKSAFERFGEAGLENRSCAPKNPANQKPAGFTKSGTRISVSRGQRFQ